MKENDIPEHTFLRLCTGCEIIAVIKSKKLKNNTKFRILFRKQPEALTMGDVIDSSSKSFYIVYE